MRTTMFAALMAVLATYTLSATVDVLDLRNPSMPTQFGSLDIVADLAPRSVGAANSVDTRFGILVLDLSDPKGSSSCPPSKARMARHS